MFKIKFPTFLFVVEKIFRHIGWVKKKSKIFSGTLAGDISAKLSLCFCRSSPVSSFWKLAITFFLGTFRKNKFFFPRSDFYSEQFGWVRIGWKCLYSATYKKKNRNVSYLYLVVLPERYIYINWQDTKGGKKFFLVQNKPYFFRLAGYGLLKVCYGFLH